MAKIFWYDVCNDYSLEAREPGTPEDIVNGEFYTEYHSEIEAVSFGFDREEGPVYLMSRRGDLNYLEV